MLSEARYKKQELVACYHCGATCNALEIRVDEHSFCCDGCKLVYQLLKENDLCNYYSLTEAPGHPSEEKAHKEYEVLDRPEIRSTFLRFDDGERARVTFRVEGMHCSSCIWLLEHLPRFKSAIISSVVNFPVREITVDFRSAEIRLAEIAGLLAAMGYAPSVTMNDAAAREKTKKYDPRVIKIGLAGFCFANIMLFSFPEYLAPDAMAGHEGLARFFSWLSLGLSLPVLLYSGSGFFVSAWKAIRYRSLNIDAPIALAIAVTFLRSVYAIVVEGQAGYLDSMSGIIFFMLLGRYFQDRTYERLNFDRDYRSYFPIAVTVKKESGEENIPVTQLKPGDQMYIRSNELIPADAVLQSECAYIDYSFVTGESEPVRRVKGDRIFAGARQTGGACMYEVTNSVSSSYLTQLWNNDAVSKRKEEVHRTYIDRINKWFSAAVLLAAFGGAIGWLFVDPAVSLNAMTAVLIVACPCTLLLSATFTNGSVLRWLGRSKFYLKNADAIDRLATADTIIFDKTGTITSSVDAGVVYEGEALSKSELADLVLLARQSSHPLSRSIVQAYSSLVTEGRIENVTEKAGGGITGIKNDRHYLLGSAAMAGAELSAESGGSKVWVAIDGNVKGKFIVRHGYRNGLKEMAERLRSRYRIELLSGDNDTEREALQEVFGDQMFFRNSPTDKLEHIDRLRKSGRRVIMIGDGLNDAGALMAADAGIAVSDNTNNYFPACDAILDGHVFEQLDKFLVFVRKASRIVKISFVISVLYNFVGVYFSLSGQMSPLIAAVLMPASSVSVVLFTTLAVRVAAHRHLRNAGMI